MQNISLSSEKQPNVTIESFPQDYTCHIYVRQNHHQVQVPDEGVHWECDEAYMELPLNEQPEKSEVEENIEMWFDYAKPWAKAKPKSLSQLQADIEYIADMSGIDLEV